MTNPTPHGQVPEALRLAHIFDNPLPPEWPDMVAAAAELRRQHARIAELEAEIAGGVQALSAAPAGWRELAARVMDALADAQDKTNSEYPEHVKCYPSWASHARWLRWHADMFRTGKPVGNGAGQPGVLAALAASPTPPAEQQAQPSDAENLRRALRFYADGEHFIKSDGDAWDTVSGEPQNYWCDEAGTATVEDGSIAKLALEGHAVRFEDDDTPQPKAAPQHEAQEPCPTCAALARTVILDQVSFDRKPDCYGIRQITNDEGVEEWEDIRTSPDVAREEANDMMATGRGEIYEVVPLWTTPQPSLTAKAADSVLEDAARLDWLALAGPVSICVVIDRPHDGEVEVSTDDVTGYGKTLREAIDAALAAQGGK